MTQREFIFNKTKSKVKMKLVCINMLKIKKIQRKYKSVKIEKYKEYIKICTTPLFLIRYVSLLI